MRVLLIAPRFVLPADTGAKIRTWNILKQVAKHCQVHLVCFSFEKDDLKRAEILKEMNIRFTLVDVPPMPLARQIPILVFGRQPLSVSKYVHNKMQETLKNISHTNRFDLVHIDHIHMAFYQEYFSGIPCLLDEHNVEYKILERCERVETNTLKKMVFQWQSRKMKRYEADVLKRFNAVTAVSEDDQKLLNQLTQHKAALHTIPNGVDTEFFHSDQMERNLEEDSLVYTGSMDWFPNEDAVKYFCQEILPLIWRTNPNVKLYVVGKNPTREMKNMAGQEKRVIVTGGVEDVRPFIQKAKVFVVPLRIGGGTRLKILEAMSMKKAIVSTSIGAEGIDYRAGKDILIADEPPEFARKVIELLNQTELSQTMGEEARKLVCSRYDWNIVGQKLWEIYEKIAGR